MDCSCETACGKGNSRWIASVRLLVIMVTTDGLLLLVIKGTPDGSFL